MSIQYIQIVIQSQLLQKYRAVYLYNNKRSSLTNCQKILGAGNVYIGAGFGHSRKATFNVTVATFNTDVLAAQNGTEVVTGSTEITYYDIITVGAEGAASTKFKAIGAAGSEISFLYKLNNDGTYGKSFTQAATAESEGQFTYTSGTKAIAFYESDPDKPVEGDILACAYKFKSADNAQKITINSDGIPLVVLVSAYGIARDVCTGELFPCVIEGQAQVDGNWSFDVSADGEPVVQSLNMEFVKGCIDKTLYTFTVFTEDEAEG